MKDQKIDAIVIDDGSTDNTAEIAEREGAYLIIRHPSNQGKGSALKNGFRAALDRGYDLIITMDADGQHNADMIPFLIKEIGADNGDLIIGNRLHSPEGMPLYRLFVNKLFSKITSLVCGQNIPDVACGYRIIRKEVLESIKLDSDKFDIDAEIIIKSAKAGFRIGTTKIKCIYADESSHIRPMQYWNGFFRLIIRELKSS